MLIKRKSELTGKIHEKEIDVDQQQFLNWASGIHIAHAMPNVSAVD